METELQEESPRLTPTVPAMILKRKLTFRTAFGEHLWTMKDSPSRVRIKGKLP